MYVRVVRSPSSLMNNASDHGRGYTWASIRSTDRRCRRRIGTRWTWGPVVIGSTARVAISFRRPDGGARDDDPTARPRPLGAGTSAGAPRAGRTPRAVLAVGPTRRGRPPTDGRGRPTPARRGTSRRTHRRNAAHRPRRAT